MAKIEIQLPGGEKAGQTLQELQKEAGKLYKELSKLPETSAEFAEKSKRFQEVEGNVKKVKDQIRGTGQASTELKNQFSQFIPFSGQFAEIGEKIGGVRSGVGGLASGMGTLRGAIIATGLGALVVILGSLISYFTSTQEGIDKVTAVTRPLSAIMERLKGVLQELGQKVFKTLADAINNPKQAFLDLGNIIKDNIIKRFEALSLFGPALKKLFSGDLAGGFKDLGNAAIQATTGVENGIDKMKSAATALGGIIDEAIKTGSRLDELQKSIEKGEIAQIKRSKELDLAIKQQKFIVEDANKSYAERTEAANKALDAQEALLNSELSLLDQKIEKMRLEQTLNDTSREQQKELAELEAQRLEKEAQITEQRIEFRNKINEFEKAQADERKAREQQMQDLRLQALKDGADKELAQIQLDTERKIAALTGSQEERQAMELDLVTIAERKKQEIIDKYAEQQRAKEQEARDKKKAQEEKDLQDKIARIELDLATEQNAANEALLQQRISEEEYYLQSAANAMNHQAQKLEILRTAHGEQSAEFQKEKATYLQMQQEMADHAVAIKKQEMADQMAAMQGALGTFGNFFGTLASMQKQGSAQWKAFATTQAIISTIQSSINAYQSTAAIPVIGPALAPIAAGLALAAGYQNVRKIQSQKIEAPVKAERGMVLHGPSHANGGIPVEAEGDEIILTKGVYRNPYLRRVASALNVMGGGRRFEAGGPINPLASPAPGASAGSRAGAGAAGLLDNSAVVAELQALRAEFAALPTRWKAYVVASEVAAMNNQVEAIMNEADV